MQFRNKKPTKEGDQRVTSLGAKYKEGVGCRNIYCRQINK
ncbi:hypothetical protein CGRA01v4_14682 [Colletotrichum graminicola]|nr:hypothetical protein CGRA01v4_14682 [Colletotrichum graminicola]